MVFSYLSAQIGRMMISGNGEKVWAFTGLGAAICLAFAVWQAVGAPELGAGRSEVAASVNGTIIPTREYEMALEALQKDREHAVPEREKEKVLSNLIREELLVQRSLSLGLFESDRGVRKAAVEAMLQFAAAQSAYDASEQSSREWFEENKHLFQRFGSYKIDVAIVENRQQADEMGTLLQQVSFDGALERVKHARKVNLPVGLTSAQKLSDYVGPAVVGQLKLMAEGDIAGPVSLPGDQYAFVWLKNKTPDRIPDYDELADYIQNLRERDAREIAVKGYIDKLWQRADIEIYLDVNRQ
jgi:PPIC-type PPIASE domain/SurA-like N-terminal domain